MLNKYCKGCNLLQVSLNQLALAPVVLSAVFTWNLILQQKSSEVRGKLKRDLLPTMVNGIFVAPDWL